MHGVGILKCGNQNMIVGNWKESMFHGVIFKFNHSRNFWSIEEYESGVFKKKILEKEFLEIYEDDGKIKIIKGIFLYLFFRDSLFLLLL